jgi:phosphatidylserine/phosphatidylglycerophosphate/cardiolipin synthase-like enzyme
MARLFWRIGMFRKRSHFPTHSEFFDEHTFFRAFSTDIKKAKSEVIIESPYITKRRATEFANLCSKYARKGLKITIQTRNPNHHDYNLRDQALIGIKIIEEAGITVRVFDDLRHRKLAIIDGRILWEGSLNMLSHSNSKEIMRGDKSNILCRKVNTIINYL